MSFRDYALDPAANTQINEIYIGPNMERAKVRPALQQLAADGREVWDQITAQADELTETFSDALVAAGVTLITPVRLAATANVTIASPGATIDGVTAANGDRVLLPVQSAGAQNGAYIFNGAASPMTRATDFDETSEVVTGAYVRVLEGATQAGAWVLTTAGAIVVGTTAQVWTQFSVDALAILGQSGGSAEVGFLQSGTGAVARTVEAKARDWINLRDFGNPASDASQAFQYAVNQGNVIIPRADWTMSWAALSADISIPANRKIITEKGAVITNTGGRFTAENVDNVEWQIDGWIKSVAMRTAARKGTWSAAADDERGFIEFGSDYSAGTARSGFRVWGSGKVSGDWTGTPNVSDLSNQVNRKGICCWNAKNVHVDELEVYGFEGEAVYAFFFDTASHNIVFERLNVHDTRFNALNFNAGANGGGCKIRNNRVRDAFAVEASAGEITDNHVHNMANSGIWTGAGNGFSVDISRNRVSNSGIHGIATSFASGTPVSSITIQGNTISSSGQYSIHTDYVRDVLIDNNQCIGTGTLAGGYDIGINHMLRGLVTNNKFSVPGFGAQAGRIAVDANSFDVSIDPDTNVYIPTTGTAPPMVGNGVLTIASAAAVTLPLLGSTFLITGTTNITSMVATGNNGRKVTLIFAGVLNFTDGSNLKLASTLATTADDVIQIVCDGTNWYEVARSVN